MLGVKKLQRYHLYAPLTIKVSHQKRFTYGEAVDTVLQTFVALLVSDIHRYYGYCVCFTQEIDCKNETRR
jgi:hypothetical protein